MKLLIMYYSETGNTTEMAKAISIGASEVKGTNVLLKRVEKTSLKDLLDSDAIIIGSPTYYGLMAAPVKKLIDKTVDIHGKLEGKVGAAFTSSGGSATGAETTILSILQAMLVHGMIVQGNPDDKHYGVACIGRPKKNDLKLCRKFGKRTAELALRLSKAELR